MADEKKKVLDEVFCLFDKDKSGKIDATELKGAVREYYKTLKESVSDQQIDADVGAILSACDTSMDGKIDKQEWFKFFEV